MIQVHKDPLGNPTGYWDTELNCWVAGPPPTTAQVMEAIYTNLEVEATDEVDPNSLTKDQLIEVLRGWDVTIPPRASKLMLVDLYLEQIQTQE